MKTVFATWLTLNGPNLNFSVKNVAILNTAMELSLFQEDV